MDSWGAKWLCQALWLQGHGLLVAVELFHICVPGRGHERGHFIGITEAENSLSSHASFSDSGSAPLGCQRITYHFVY